MKKTFLPILAATALILLPCSFSCDKTNQPDNQEGKENQEPEKPVDDGKPKAGDYTFTVSPLKGQWEAGDKIQVHGSYAPAAKTYTLQASNISSDGKTATLKLEGEILEYFANPDNLYAAWPGELVKAEDGLLDATTTFSKADVLLAQAYLQGTNFTFDDASAAITFTVSGGYDKMIIAGAQRPGLRFNEYSNSHSTAETSFSKVVSDGYPFREVSLAGDGKTTTVWFPGGVTLTGGFTLYFGKDGAWPKTFTSTDDVKLKAGNILELGDVSAKLADYTGPKPSMPEITKMTKYSVKFNEFSGLCLSADNSFLWAIDDNGNLGRIDITNNVGEVLESWSLGGDPEGISIHPETGNLIVGNEDPVAVGLVKAPVKKGDKQTTLFKIKEAKGFGNSGMEGITYYKKNGDRDLIYCGTQTDALLFLCDLNEAVDSDKYTKLVSEPISLRKRFPGVLEIAGLSYDPLTDWLWMVDSEAHKIFVFSGDASQLLCTYALKTKSNEEGICVDHSRGCVWIADDYGNPSYLYKYEFGNLEDYVTK